MNVKITLGNYWERGGGVKVEAAVSLCCQKITHVRKLWMIAERIKRRPRFSLIVLSLSVVVCSDIPE
jgi:hypothetical protein